MKINCAHSEVVEIETLVAHPRNPNKHSEKQLKYLAKILKHQGWRHPVTVSNRSGFVVAGHGRIEAARINGWDHVPIDRQNFETEADEYAHLIADNKIAELADLNLAMVNEDVIKLGEGFDLDLLGIPDFRPVEIEVFEAQTDDDNLPSLGTYEARAKLGDVWQLGRHRLLCGDSTEMTAVDRLFGEDRAELCFTSPPYADQREYNGGKELSTQHLATFIRSAFHMAKYFAVNLGYSRKNGEVNPYWEDYILEAKNCGLKFLSWNIWDKGEAGSIGNQTAMFAIQHEWVFVFGPGPKALNLTVPNKNRDKLRHGSIRQADGSVTPVRNTDEKVREFSQLKTVLVQTPQKARNHGLNHPAMFPVEFPEHYINAMTQPGEIVFEPFGGSGSTLIACEKTGRSARVIELDPKYCDLILKRWEQYTGLNATRISQ